MPKMKPWKTFVSLALAAGLLFGVSSLAQAQARDCDDNAVIRCGTYSLTELKQKYRENQGGNLQAIFTHFGISNEAALDGMVEGRITSANEVFVGDRKVAINALTAGRQNMPGSTPILNGQAYKRPPGVSFRSSPLAAFVKMENGVFKYAVIKSCGNPVTAKAVKPPEQPKPQPTPPPDRPAAQPEQPREQPPQPPAPPPAIAAAAPALRELPKTGVGDAAAIFFGTSLLGTAFYRLRAFYQRLLR